MKTLAKTAFALSLMATPALAQGQADSTVEAATEEFINSIQLNGSCVVTPMACNEDFIRATLEATGCSIADVKAYVEDPGPDGTPAPKGCKMFMKRLTNH